MSHREAVRLVENHIDAWVQNPELKQLAAALKKRKEEIVGQVAEILERKDLRRDRRGDRARAFLLQCLPGSVKLHLELDHLVIHKMLRTVELILEGAFGISLERDATEVQFPYEEEVSAMVCRCILHLRERDVITFMALFLEGPERAGDLDQDKSMRYRSMIWFAYILIDMIRVDPERMCSRNATYAKTRMRELLDKAMEAKIIAEGSSSTHGFEEGKWSDTFFGWMQGDENRPFLIKLRKQFNLDNKVAHGNRMLLAKHRNCMVKQAVQLFCPNAGGPIHDR